MRDCNDEQTVAHKDKNDGSWMFRQNGSRAQEKDLTWGKVLTYTSPATQSNSDKIFVLRANSLESRPETYFSVVRFQNWPNSKNLEAYGETLDFTRGQRAKWRANTVSNKPIDLVKYSAATTTNSHDVNWRSSTCYAITKFLKFAIYYNCYSLCVAFFDQWGPLK